jgi:hypothetical protein
MRKTQNAAVLFNFIGFFPAVTCILENAIQSCCTIKILKFKIKLLFDPETAARQEQNAIAAGKPCPDRKKGKMPILSAPQKFEGDLPFAGPDA